MKKNATSDSFEETFSLLVIKKDRSLKVEVLCFIKICFRLPLLSPSSIKPPP